MMYFHKDKTTDVPAPDCRLEGFQSIIKYLSKLYRDGDITGDVFERLLREALAGFVEAEISDHVESVIERSLFSKGRISIERMLELL